MLVNDFIKIYIYCDCISMIVNLLNVVLNTGCVHIAWCSDLIRSLYKNKGLLLTLITIGYYITVCTIRLTDLPDHGPVEENCLSD